MVFRHFKIGIVWRVLMIAATSALSIYLWMNTTFYFSAVIVSIVVILFVIGLIRYAEKTNEKLTRFLNAIQYSDFSSSFTDIDLGSSFKELNQAFNAIVEKFKKERSERQESLRYLETVVQHVGVGLLAFNRQGEVELLNVAAKRMLNLPVLRHIDGLKEIHPSLYRSVLQLRSGNKKLVVFESQNHTHHWAIHSTEFIMRGDNYKLVSLQNISSELEEKEMEAWQNLTRVLAHEIMNSITPIASLSETIYTILDSQIQKEGEKSMISNVTLNDVEEALATIKNRSYGLMKFVQSYRDFTQIPEPDKTRIHAGELISRVINLMRGEFEKNEIRIEVNLNPEEIFIFADPQLLEQVLINLLKNALRAIKNTHKPEITCTAYYNEDGEVRIDIKDNGPGIPKKLFDKIFIPFYTYRGDSSEKGTGIGLSLSRQIMRLHNGSLTVKSDPGAGTVFTLNF